MSGARQRAGEPPAGEALVEVADLAVAYRQGDGWTRVVHNVNFRIAAGEVFGLVGESGCGKTTVAYQLLGYLRPNSLVEGGRVLFKGRDLLRLERDALDELRGNRIALVPQNPTTALNPGMRIGDQIFELLLAHGVSRGRQAAKKRTVELFRLVGLPDPARILRRFPHQLSGGQQQRVTIAMALACEPDLVVLDEPTTGLDVTTQKQIIALLTDLRRRIRMAMLYVTHDLGLLAQIADRVGVMYAGHMVEIASTGDLFTQPRHPYTRGLIASVPRLDSNGAPQQPLRGLLQRDTLPAGCPFQPRCDFAEASCAGNMQQLEPVGPSHLVACQRWRSLSLPALVQLERESPAPQAEDRARPLLELEYVRLSYSGGRSPLARLLEPAPPPVVPDISFSVGRAEVFALVGESGSGKSTIARAIAGLIAPQGGEIRFDGKALPGRIAARSRSQRRRIQYIFQNPDASLNPRMTVGRILARQLRVLSHADNETVRKRVALALEDVRLEPRYATRYPDQLSGGERQRVAIARALIADPELLLCDEILSALDVSVQANVLELLVRLRREHEVAMLFISHDLAVVRSLADRVGVLFRGQLMEVGSTEEIFAPPFHPYTHTLLVAASHRRTDSLPTTPQGAPPGTGTGCAFAGRCAWQKGRLCAEQAPPWQDAGASLRIRCHIPVEELRRRAVWSAGGAAAPLPEEATAARVESKGR